MAFAGIVVTYALLAHLTKRLVRNWWMAGGNILVIKTIQLTMFSVMAVKVAENWLIKSVRQILVLQKKASSSVCSVKSFPAKK